MVQTWVTDAGLTLHPTKTRIVDVREERFAFLGYEFHGTERWPRKKSLKKVRDALRTKTKRTVDRSFKTVIAELNLTLLGWFLYIQHCSSRYVIRRLDQWLRMRLRSILRYRRGGRGPVRGADHQRWRNRYFSEQGLFSLEAAHAAACQSSRR